jgi:hypothetical protein
VADPKRLVILKALCAHIEAQVRVSNGFQHDLQGRVFRGRSVFGQDDPLPMVSVLEAPRPDQDLVTAKNGMQLDDWPLYFQGWAQDDPSNPTDPAYRLAADVKQALAMLIDRRPESAPYYLLGDLILDLTIGPGTVRPPDQLSSWAYFYLPVTVKLKESLTDPYRLT